MISNKRKASVVLHVALRCPMALPATGVVSFWTNKSANLLCSWMMLVKPWRSLWIPFPSFLVQTFVVPLPPLPTVAIDFIFLSFNGVNKFFKVFMRPEQASDRCISKWHGTFLKHRARQETGEDKAYIRVQWLQPRWRERMKNFM